MAQAKRRSPAASRIPKNQGPEITDLPKDVLNQLEFHRHALALLPDPSDNRPGVVFFVEGERHTPAQRFCTCSLSATKTCSHQLKLAQVFKQIKRTTLATESYEHFRSSVWHRLAAILADGSRVTAQNVQTKMVGRKDSPNAGMERPRQGGAIRLCTAQGEEAATYLANGPGRIRFVERFGSLPQPTPYLQRAEVLNRLALLTLTESERLMMDRGYKTQRQAFEESLWYRMAYHGYREFGDQGGAFQPAIETSTGMFYVTFTSDSGTLSLRLAVRRENVRRLLSALKEMLPNQHHMEIHPIPLKSIFKVDRNTELDLEVRPLIQLIQQDGEARFFEREALERFTYGDLVYVPELGVLAELEPSEKSPRKFVPPVRMVLKKSQIPNFIEEFQEELEDGSVIGEGVKGLKVFNHFDRIELKVEAIERDWCWLSVSYGLGNVSVSLAEILNAKKEKQAFIGTPEGWVDVRSPALEVLDQLVDRDGLSTSPASPHLLRLSRMDLFRVTATDPDTVVVKGEKQKAGLLKKILALSPKRTSRHLKGLTSNLRTYQRLGLEWIRFLDENGFGGLLCDEMGLGKTHQIMAYFLSLYEREGRGNPFLVVCPTTVLSHWTKKIRDHIPSLKAVLYHGGERDLVEAISEGHILLTSYGILRRDIEALKQLEFRAAVFDEVQHVKNPGTLAYQAAREIRAAVKIGVSGTPIENSLSDLKALFDLTLPGYLGDNQAFATRYIAPIQENPAAPAQKRLSRLIHPFVLRRLKKSVLQELPPKIEDMRTCRLSDDQVKIYRDAIDAKGRPLVVGLRNHKRPIPYIHIFALLTLLKQICDHPALAKGNTEEVDRYGSGKWELFKELLAECLDSGQKVVIYSQFLGMIEIIGRYLKSQAIDFVTLTGTSRNRGEIIARFNDDPQCRVFVGSLKAGGLGIDLVAASVVIHYDRWWNAAREDQATDRVHRIGQRRGVQVFKLVTEGTLEEKIAAIIERKRDLMDRVVKEDDPALVKTFSREELLELLSEPV
jgi:superfamily II DNA or RNA helicase